MGPRRENWRRYSKKLRIRAPAAFLRLVVGPKTRVLAIVGARINFCVPPVRKKVAKVDRRPIDHQTWKLQASGAGPGLAFARAASDRPEWRRLFAAQPWESIMTRVAGRYDALAWGAMRYGA